MRCILKCCLFLLIFTNCLFSQKGNTLNGFVYDVTSGEALIGANVYLNEIKLGTSSNTSGYFVITDIPGGEYDLNCSYIGYKSKSQKIKVTSEKNIFLKIYLESITIKQKEVVVIAEPVRVAEKLYQQPISKIELTPSQINKIPQVIESDLLRSLQALPGIVSLSDFSSALYVRGGSSDQNLYLLDGTDVYNPEHAFGIFSTFNTDAIKKIEISKGGFGAEYGGRLSSILTVTNLDGNRNNFEGNIGISLMAAKTTLQMPLGDFGSLSGSIRRTYFDMTVAKLLEDVPNYYFYDGNLKAFIEAGDKDKITFSYYGGRDNLDYKFKTGDPLAPAINYSWGNTTFSANWKRIINPNLFGNLWITYSEFSSNFDYNTIKMKEDNSIDDLTIKGSFDYFASGNLIFKLGFEQKNFFIKYKQTFPGRIIDANRDRQHYIGYLSANWKPDILWDIEPGLHYDLFSSDQKYSNLDPRLSIKYRLSESSNLKFAAGIYHQYLTRVERGFIVGVWAASDKYIDISSAKHAIFGYQMELFKDYQLEFETYYKDYKNLHSFNYNALTAMTPQEYTADGTPLYKELKGVFYRGDGNSRGLEIIFRKDAGVYTGWIGYALSAAKITVDGMNQNNDFTPRFVRNSVINAVLNFNFSDLWSDIFGKDNEDTRSKWLKENHESGSSTKWLIGLNFVYSTGQPITLPGSTYTVKPLPDGTGENMSIYPTEINEFRLPYYARLDFSITYEKIYASGWTIAPYLQIYNIGNRKNVWFAFYDNKPAPNGIAQDITTISMLPVLPSIGINIKF